MKMKFFTTTFMHLKKNRFSFSTLLLSAFCFFQFANVSAAAFTKGNLVVLRVGDGTAALGSGSTAVFLDEYTNSGTFVQSVSIPTSGSNVLSNSGTATSEGMVTLSPDAKYLTLAGYNVAPGTASINGTTSSATNRKLLMVDYAGNFSNLLSSTAYSANNIRCGVTNGTDSWAAGTGSTAGTNGVQYFGTGTAGQVSSTMTNVRVVNIFNGQLYFSTGSATVGIYKVGTGLPTGTGVTSTIEITVTGTSPSPYSFSFNSDNTVCYVADDRTTANGGGIIKYTNSGGVWSSAYTLSLGIGSRGMTVDWTGTNPVIYAVGTDSKIYKVEDSGSSATASALATATTNTAFRGIAFVPIASISTGLTEVEGLLSISKENNEIVFSATEGESVVIYSTTGQKLMQKSTVNGVNKISVNAVGVILVKVGNRIAKVVL